MKKLRKERLHAQMKLLKNYSALSASFLAISSTAIGQVVYKDVDPDLNVFIDEVTLDLDANGINDFKLIFVSETFATFVSAELKLRINPLGENKVGYALQTIPVTYSGAPFSTYNSGATEIVFTNVPLLNEGAVIDDGTNFILDKAALFEKLYFYIYSSSNAEAFEGGFWNETENHFAPIQLYIDGNYHYGWMRLNVSAVDGIALLDFAYEATPDVPITTALHNYSISWIAAGDGGITESPEDLIYSFNAAPDEADFESYRVICVKSGVEISVEEANSLTPDKYVEIIPDGSLIYSGNFSATILDSDGDIITTDQTYKLITLQVMQEATNYLNLLSLASDTFQLVDTVSVVEALNITDIDDNGNASDIRINFDAPTTEQGIIAYRIFVAQKDAADIFTLEQALTLGAERYVEILPGAISYEIIPPVTLLNTDGNNIEPDKYKAFVVSIPDGTTVEHAIMTAASNNISLEQSTSVVENILLEDIGESGDGSDLKVAVTIPDFEQTIESYRLFFVDFATAFSFDLDAALASTNFIEIIPTGSDINIFGNATTRDSNGEVITWGVPYYAYVLAIASDYGINDTLSLPSNQVILNFPVAIADGAQTGFPEIFSTAGVIHVELPNSESAIFELYNTAGQKIHSQNLQSENTAITIPYASGIYFARVLTAGAWYYKKVQL